jgi:hypothetical protein
MEEMKRFVIQRHTRQDEPLLRCASDFAYDTPDRPKGRQVHWDLMLEHGDFLETYRISIPPEQWGKEPIEAVKIFDHPLKFLTYEGIVNNGKGTVTVADKGTYEVLSQNENQLKIRFSGTILKREIIFAVGGGRVRRE